MPQRYEMDISGSQFTLFSPYISISQSHIFHSSLAAFESNDNHKMDAYMDYLIVGNPAKADKLGEIKEQF